MLLLVLREQGDRRVEVPLGPLGSLPSLHRHRVVEDDGAETRPHPTLLRVLQRHRTHLRRQGLHERHVVGADAALAEVLLVLLPTMRHDGLNPIGEQCHVALLHVAADLRERPNEFLGRENRTLHRQLCLSHITPKGA